MANLMGRQARQRINYETLRQPHQEPTSELAGSPGTFDPTKENSARRSVARVIEMMRSGLGDQLTLDDMARAASYSKFHFSRMFQRETGVSPGRFLSALRLERAKYLLISTSFNVADISMQVGYTSIGSFSTRFTRSVGLAPTTYRRLRGFTSQIQVEPVRSGQEWAYGTVTGTIWPDKVNQDQVTFIGLFRDRIPEGRPVSCAVLENPSQFVLDKVPTGTWFLLSHSVSTDKIDSAIDLAHAGVEVSCLGPITMRRGLVVNVDVRLRQMCLLDPPVLLSLLDVRRSAMEQVAAREESARSAFRDHVVDRLAA